MRATNSLNRIRELTARCASGRDKLIILHLQLVTNSDFVFRKYVACRLFWCQNYASNKFFKCNCQTWRCSAEYVV